MDGILNGAGPLVVVSALPMLAGLLLSGAWAAHLRRLAIVLALALPIALMAAVATLYLPHSDSAFFDFQVNHQAASVLYGTGGDPYSVHAAYSFPFPTFYLYWIFGGLGSLSETQAWVAWWVINGLLWAGCAWLLWRVLPPAASPLERDMRLYTAVAIPAITTLWEGQTALFILLGLVGVHVAALSGRSRWGGIGLALAALVKPQLALVGLGIVLWGILARRSSRYLDMWPAIRIVILAALVALALIILTILLPGGVTVETYRQFVAAALPQVARPADALVIGSPAFVAGAIALSLGASERTADLLANAVTVLILAIAVLWTLRRAGRPLTEVAAGWGVWAMVAPRVTWMWYAAWCLPFFLLAVQETVCERRSAFRLALIVIVLALVNLQVDSLVVAAGTILLLIALLWTSFQPNHAHVAVG